MRIIILLISFFIFNSSFAQNKKSYLRDGNKLYTDSSYTEAEIKYRKSLEKDQDYFNASFNLADAIYKQERFEESSALFNAIKENAKNKNDLSKIYHNLGNSLFKEGKLDEAIKAYKNALRLKPDDDDTRFNLIYTKKQKQDNKEKEKENKEEEKEKENKEEEKEKDNKEEEKEKDNKQEEKEKDNKEEQEQMSKEDAEKMLEAIQQQEKDLQEALQKKKVKGKRSNILKDW